MPLLFIQILTKSNDPNRTAKMTAHWYAYGCSCEFEWYSTQQHKEVCKISEKSAASARFPLTCVMVKMLLLLFVNFSVYFILNQHHRAQCI